MAHQENLVTAPIILREEIGSERILLHCKVPVDLHYFQGHFADVAVVPGVCQLKWIMDAIDHYFGRKPVMTGMEAVKFHQLLFPGDEFLMEIKRGANGQKWAYHLSSGPRKIASGRVLDAGEAAGSGEIHEPQL